MKVNVEGIEIDGTHLQGKFSHSFQEIKSVFGDPIAGADPGDKVQAEWAIQFDDGTVATIYDWKEWGTSYENVKNWHVGGHNPKAFEAVMSKLRSNTNLV